jgi:hypothetical protein
MTLRRPEDREQLKKKRSIRRMKVPGWCLKSSVQRKKKQKEGKA